MFKPADKNSVRKPRQVKNKKPLQVHLGERDKRGRQDKKRKIDKNWKLFKECKIETYEGWNPTQTRIS